jgi:glycine cleavage system H protein
MAFRIEDSVRHEKTHEWIRVDGNDAVIGISDYAQDRMFEVALVDLPTLGKTARKEGALLVIESAKALEDLFSPVRGTVTAVSYVPGASPELVNKDPFGEGWLLEVNLSDANELDSFTNVEACRVLLATL